MNYRKKHIGPKIKGLRKKRRFFQRPLFWIFLFFIILIGGVLYVVLFLPQIQIAAVKISGNKKIPTGAIESLAWDAINKKTFGISYKSMLMEDGKNIENVALQKFHLIESIEVQKEFPNTILMTVKEREPFAVFCQEGDYDCFLMDKHGIIFEPQAGPMEPFFIIEKTQDTQKAVLGQQAIETELIGGITKIQKDLQDNFGVQTLRIQVGDTLVFDTNEHWKIYFDPKENMDLQMAKLNILLKDRIPEDARKSLQYIYLQYKDRAYYK